MKKVILKLFIICSLLLLRVGAYAQTSVIVKGIVSDRNGEAVPGAVISDGNDNNSVSSLDGAFEIRTTPDAVLSVSALGYHIWKGKAGNNLRVILDDDTYSLDEVVVIGYGTQRKKDLTGSIVQIDMEAMEDKEAISLADYLRGSVAGLNISRSSSLSGQSSFEIRGQTSLGTSTSPLIVLDGSIFNGSINEINPNDIASVSVMKDASSAAVYGASAANGVLLISSKKGKTEKPRITFDVKTSFATLTAANNMPESYDVDGYLKVRADKLTGNSDIILTKPEYYSNPYKLAQVSLEEWMAYSGAGKWADPTEIWLSRLALTPNEKANYYNYKSVDWVDEVFRTGFIQDYNASVSGGNEKVNYYWSVGYLDNKGVIEGDNYSTLRSRLNLSANITDFLEVGVRTSLSNSRNDGHKADWTTAYTSSPLGDKYESDGTYTIYPNGDNMAKNPFEKTQWDIYNHTFNLQANAFAKITLPFGFAFESIYSNHWRWNENNTFKPSYTLDGSSTNGEAARQNTNQYDWSIENILRWQKTFGRHSIDVTLMQSAAKWEQNMVSVNSIGFNTSELLGWHALSLADTHSATSLDQVDTKASYMARINYSALDRYLVTLTVRRDGYSAFGQDNPWGAFPAVGLAWRMSEEKFMKNIPFVSNLKIRASYGKNGNSNIGRYTALASLGTDYYIDSSKQGTVTLYPTSMGNSKLQWEETVTKNIGLDFGILDNRVNLTIDGYMMNTTNMLMDRTLPTITGYSKVKSNLGQVDNRGLEVTINSLNMSRKNFKWNTDLTFSMNRNNIVHLYGNMVDVYDEEGNVIGQKEADDPTNGWYIGHSIDEIYGYKIIGVWQMDEAAEAAALGRTPGDYKTYITEGHTSYSSEDYQWQGFTKPRYRFSINNTFTLWKSVSVNFLLRSEIGHIKANNEINVGNYADRVSQMKFPYWTQENSSDEWGKLGAARTGNIYRNASFLRFENISVSWSLPSRWLEKIKVSSAKLSFNVDNAYCFDSWLYWDVETKSPLPTTYTIGINFSL